MSAREFSGKGIRVSPTKSHNAPHAPGDTGSSGYEKGAKGYANAGGKDQNMWDTQLSSERPNMDRAKLYGPKSDGGNVGNFPGDDLTDTFKGSFGVDRFDRDQDGDDR